MVYIGSTTQSLSRRFSKHKGMSDTHSRQIIDVGDSYIELVEECKCDNKDQLLRREGQIIRSMDCVNKQIEGRTKAEWREDHKEEIKQYYIDNKEEYSARQKQYRHETETRANETDTKPKRYRND